MDWVAFWNARWPWQALVVLPDDRRRDRSRADGSRRLATVYRRLRAGERDGYASTMPVKKPIESKPSIKVEMNVANSPDVGEKGSAVVQIKISGSSAAARDRVAKAISEAVRAACQNLAQPPKRLH